MGSGFRMGPPRGASPCVTASSGYPGPIATRAFRPFPLRSAQEMP